MEKMELSEAVESQCLSTEGLLGINDTWYKKEIW